MRKILSLALACASIAPLPASAAPYFRNVAPSMHGAGASPTNPTTPTNPTGPTTPVVTPDPKPDPKPDPEPEPEPVAETGPLTLTLAPSGDINATWQAPVNAVFHAGGACGGHRFVLDGAGENQVFLTRYGLSGSASGRDYVIAGQINQAGYGGSFNLTLTARNDCGETAQVRTRLNFNPAPPDYDPNWTLRFEHTYAFAGRPFAWYAEIQNNLSGSESVDTAGFLYELGTLDPVNRPLPTWMTLDAATGMVRGTAPTAGSFGPYFMRVRAPDGTVETVDFDALVSPSFQFAGPSSYQAKVGEFASLPFNGTGSCGGANLYYNISSDTPLPPGLSWVYREDGWLVEGTPTSGGTYPVRLTFTDFQCPSTQVFPVTITVEGAPAPLAFFQTLAGNAVVGGDPLYQVIYGSLETTTGPAWNTLDCELLDAAGNPANLSWASSFTIDKTSCAFRFAPTDPAQAGTYSFRLRATTDSRGSAVSDPIAFTVSPAAQN